jgi:hypothetical protein
MSIRDFPEIKGFTNQYWTVQHVKVQCNWISNFNDSSIHTAIDGYTAIVHDLWGVSTGITFNTLDEAANYLRDIAIINFFGDAH